MRRLAATIIVLLAGPASLAAQDFTKITGDPVVSDLRYSEGSSWGDVNNDGYLDVFVPHLYRDDRNVLFVNNGDGGFTQVTTGPVVADNGRSSGGSLADFDNDGDLDLFVANYFGDDNFYYTNNGNGTFTRVTEGVIVRDGGFSFGSSTADYDHDGWLDLFVVNGGFTAEGADNALYRNSGDGSFTKITSGPLVNDGGRSSSAAWCDYDGDGDIDLFVANGAAFDPLVVENVIYQNNGDGTFARIPAIDLGIANSYAAHGSWGDYDRDGDFDLFVANFLGNNNDLYRNDGDGTFARMTAGIVVQDGGDSVSATWGDYDNDGHLDLYVTNDFNEDNALYHNLGDGSFEKITTGDPVHDGGRSNGATWADYDRDGYLDLYVPNGQRPARQSNILYRNNGASGYNWIDIHCIGTASNRSAVGTKVRARARIDGTPVWQLRQVSGSTGFNAQNSLNIEFGLGTATFLDSLIIEWPSGMVDVYTEVEANAFYEALEGSGLARATTSVFVQRDPAVPGGSALHQNYPNPFHASTTISYALPRPGRVTLALYDLHGRVVATLVNGPQRAGSHALSLDARGLSSGVYFYRLQVDDRHVEAKKVVLVR